jgi:RNA polymerase sigma-70 factor (ECF subfamily)
LVPFRGQPLQSSLRPALDPESLPRHLDRLYRAAWALCGSPHEAEDLVQETFVRVLARPRLLRGQDELAYLMTVLRNTFLTQRRTAARRPRASPTTLGEIEPVDPRSGDRPEEALQAQEVLAAIAGLPQRYRLALVAVDVAGLSHREAAQILETKEATIATRIFRARQFVVHALESPAPGEGYAPRDAPAAEDAPALPNQPAPKEKPASETKPAPDETLAGAQPRAPREGEPARRRLTHRGSR